MIHQPRFISAPPLPSHSVFLHSPLCPTSWCAPEVLKGETPTAASNVWSFGVVLYEMQTKGAVPFEDLTPVQVKTTVLAGGHVSLPAGSADQLWAAALSCFAFEPAQRPSFQALAEELAALAKLLESEHEHPRRQYHEHDVGDDLYDFMSLGNSAEALDDATAAVVEDLPLTVPAIRAVGTDHVIVAGEGYISTETANVERHSESDLLGNPAVYNKWSPAAMLMYADQQGMVVGKGRRRSSSLPLVDGAAPLESLSKHLRLLEYGGVAVGSANKARTSVA